LFRYRTSVGGQLVLYGETDDGSEVLWRGTTAGGEGEVARDGQALALDSADYDGRFRVGMIIVPTGTEPPPPPQSLTGEALGEACPRCGWKVLEMVAP
jgi:hypothetical protein